MLNLTEPQLTMVLALTTLSGGLILAGWLRVRAKKALKREEARQHRTQTSVREQTS